MFDPYDPVVQEDPYPTYRRLRDEAPLYWNEDRGFWVLSRFDDVYAAAHDPLRFSSAQGILIGHQAKPEAQNAVPMMIMMDPPRHDELRRLVSKAFAPRPIAAMEDSVRRIAYELPVLGVDVVEVSPPYDHAEITSFLANRVVLETLTGIARRRKDAADGTTWDPRTPLLER